MNKMTRAQEIAAARVEQHIREHVRGDSKFAQIAKLEINTNEHSVEVYAKVEPTAEVNPNSLLALITSCSWLVFISKRGKVQLAMGPSSYAQFAGKRCFNLFNVNRDFSKGDFSLSR